MSTPKKKLTINISERQWHWLKSYSYSNDRQYSEIISDALDTFILEAEEFAELADLKDEKIMREIQYEREPDFEDQETRDLRQNRPEIPSL